MAIEFEPAVRRKSKARMALAGPTGSGKTYTALAWPGNGAVRGRSRGMVDTERGSVSKSQRLAMADGVAAICAGWHYRLTFHVEL